MEILWWNVLLIAQLILLAVIIVAVVRFVRIRLNRTTTAPRNHSDPRPQ